MAVNKVGSTSYGSSASTNGNTMTLTLAQASTVGNVLLLAVLTHNLTVATANTYTPVPTGFIAAGTKVSQARSATNMTIQLFYKVVTTSQSSIVINYTNSAGAVAMCEEFSGLSTTSPFDSGNGVSTVNAPSGTLSTSLTPSVSLTWVWNVFASYDTGNPNVTWSLPGQAALTVDPDSTTVAYSLVVSAGYGPVTGTSAIAPTIVWGSGAAAAVPALLSAVFIPGLVTDNETGTLSVSAGMGGTLSGTDQVAAGSSVKSGFATSVFADILTPSSFGVLAALTAGIAETENPAPSFLVASSLASIVNSTRWTSGSLGVQAAQLAALKSQENVAATFAVTAALNLNNASVIVGMFAAGTLSGKAAMSALATSKENITASFNVVSQIASTVHAVENVAPTFTVHAAQSNTIARGIQPGGFVVKAKLAALLFKRVLSGQSNVLIVVEDCFVSVAGYADRNFKQGQEVAPSSKFYWPLLWSDLATHTGFPVGV